MQLLCMASLRNAGAPYAKLHTGCHKVTPCCDRGRRSMAAFDEDEVQLLPWRVEIPMSNMNIDEFVLWREQQRQRSVVETRKPMNITPSIYFWTRRVTGTDIISMITTTRPIGAGQLKGDIGPEWAENKRPDNTVKRNVMNTKSPFKGQASNTVRPSVINGMPAITDEEHVRINNELWEEHRVFMDKLSRKRTQRQRLENCAATRVQSAFRGYLVRQRWASLRMELEVRNGVRTGLRRFFASNNLVVQGVEYRRRKKELREEAAVVIQCACRRMLSYRAYERMRLLRESERRREGAIVIQCMIRSWRSRQLVAKLRRRAVQRRRHAAATRVQAAFRGSLGRMKFSIIRRQLHHTAATMIQCMVRRCRARRRVKLLQANSQDKSREFGSKCIQRIVRGFMGRRRVAKLAAERRARRRAWAVLKIQTFCRSWSCRRRVALRRLRRRQARRLCAALNNQRVVRGFVGRRRAYNRKLLLSLDLWVQTRLGDDVLVDDIFHGADTGEQLDPDIRDDHGNTILIVAARHGHLKIVRKCLQWGVKLNATNAKGQTALNVAIAHRHPAVAEYLLSKPEALIAKTGRTLLHEAAKGGLHQCALNLANYGIDVEAVDPASGRQALHEACKHGHHHIVRLLLSRSSGTPNVQDKEGRAPLHWAAIRGSEECATQLIQAGANVRLCDALGRHALVYAFLEGHASVAETLEGCWSSTVELGPQEWTPADAACMSQLTDKGEESIIQKLLELGFPVDITSEGAYETLLMRAAHAGKKAVVDLLVKKGAALSAVNGKGQTALHLALQQPASSWDLDVKQLARPELWDMVDEDGRMPLHYGAMNGYALDRLGVTAKDVNRKDAVEGCTALHYAAASCVPQAIRAMLALGGDITAVDKQRHTCLHALAYSPDASPSSSPSGDVSPRNVKPNSGSHRDISVKDSVTALLSCPNVPVQARDNQGRTAVVAAAVWGARMVVEALLPREKDKTEVAFACVRAGQVGCLEVVKGACAGNDFNSMREEANGGLSLLGCAIMEGRHTMIEWLLSHNADATALGQSSTSRNLLHLVALYGTVQDLDALMDSGKLAAKAMEDKDSHGRTAFTCAVLCKNYPVADALLKRGAVARIALQAGTWGWVLAAAKRQERYPPKSPRNTRASDTRHSKTQHAETS